MLNYVLFLIVFLQDIQKQNKQKIIHSLVTIKVMLVSRPSSVPAVNTLFPSFLTGAGQN